MPKGKKSAANPTVVLGLALFLFLLVLLHSLRVEDVIVFAAVIVGISAIVIVVWIAASRSRRNAFLAKVDEITDAHMDALTRQRTILITSDPYGKPIFDKWHIELQYFTTNHVQPALSAEQLKLLCSDRASILQRIDLRVYDVARTKPAFAPLSPAMTPNAFEAYCADQLRTCGWEAYVTPRGPDQGVDVIAHKNGIRIVLQCKFYSNPVSNKAVQEIAAGRVHQQAHYGAVVTNNTYTASARQLAQTNGILLLHHSELVNIDSMIVPMANTSPVLS